MQYGSFGCDLSTTRVHSRSRSLSISFPAIPLSDRDQGESELKYVFHSISIRNHFANSTQKPPLIRQTVLACCFCCAFRVVRVFPVMPWWPTGFWEKHPHREPLRREPESSSALLLLCWVKKFNKFYALTFTCIRFFGGSARAPGHSIIVRIPLAALLFAFC